MRARRLVILAAAAGLGLGSCAEREIALNPDRAVGQNDLEVGRGLEAREGALITAHYRGRVERTGDVIVDTYASGTPHPWVLGDGSVIAGMDAGIRGMREGGRRRLRMPAASGYGSGGYGDAVPPNAILVFEVELLEVRSDGLASLEYRPPPMFQDPPSRRRALRR